MDFTFTSRPRLYDDDIVVLFYKNEYKATVQCDRLFGCELDTCLGVPDTYEDCHDYFDVFCKAEWNENIQGYVYKDFIFYFTELKKSKTDLQKESLDLIHQGQSLAEMLDTDDVVNVTIGKNTFLDQFIKVNDRLKDLDSRIKKL